MGLEKVPFAIEEYSGKNGSCPLASGAASLSLDQPGKARPEDECEF